jgi:hypothetical protein
MWAGTRVTATTRRRLAAQADSLLEPGEQVQAVIWGLVIRPTFGPSASLRILMSSANPFRVIVATNRRLLLCRGGRWTISLSSEVLSELPRRTLIGPAHGGGPLGMWHHTDALGERIYIRRDWFDEIANADAAAGQ